MFIDLRKIDESKHILIVVGEDSFTNASALYSYILTQHKKVSLFKDKRVDSSYSFLPWFDKLRETKNSSAEYIIEVDRSSQALYTFFQKNSVKINKKMATSLYMGLLVEHKNWSSSECDGTTFAVASELIALGAEYKICKEFYLDRMALCVWRLKAKMYESMELSKNATLASLFISESDLKSSGASLSDALNVMEDALNIVHVKNVILYKIDENNKILKEI